MAVDRSRNQAVGQALRLCREQLSETGLNEFARKIPISSSFCSEVERGQKGAPRRLIGDYERVLELRPGSILEIAGVLAREGEVSAVDYLLLPPSTSGSNTVEAVWAAAVTSVNLPLRPPPVLSIGRLFIKLNTLIEDNSMELTIRLEAEALSDEASAGFGLLGTSLAHADFSSSSPVAVHTFSSPVVAQIFSFTDSLERIGDRMVSHLRCKLPKGPVSVFRSSWTRLELLRFELEGYGVHVPDLYRLNRIHGPLAYLSERLPYGTELPLPFDISAFEDYPCEYYNLALGKLYGLDWRRQRTPTEAGDM